MVHFPIKAIYLLAGIALLVPVVGGADSLVIPSSRDNTLFLDPDGLLSSGSGPNLFVGNNSGSNTRRAVLFFDVSAIPAGAVIESAVLRLHVSSVPVPDAKTIQVLRLASNWGEGASVSNGGAGAVSASGDATWIHRFYPDDLWSTPGGDLDPGARASSQIGDVGDYELSSPELAADVRSWLENPSGNFGWILIGEEDAPSTVKRIDSREHPSEANRPVLVITFTASTPVTRTSWGRLKSLPSGTH